MSISEQVKELRKLANGIDEKTRRFQHWSAKRWILEAADTIEILYAKLADMERPEKDCCGWTECESGKLPDKEVICCDVCGEIIIGYIHETYESEQTGFSAENSHEYMYNCVKWMEKPKP